MDKTTKRAHVTQAAAKAVVDGIQNFGEKLQGLDLAEVVEAKVIAAIHEAWDEDEGS